MALPDIDSSVGHSFSLEIDGVQIAGITEVSGLALEQDVIEMRETAADGTVIIRKVPGRPRARLSPVPAAQTRPNGDRGHDTSDTVARSATLAM